jgi:hypothetical protein
MSLASHRRANIPGTAMSLSRRALLGATGLATMPALPEPWAIRPAAAQSERVLRYGISMADIPQTTGQPDRGAGAYQFVAAHPRCCWVVLEGLAGRLT